jgi:hypothetical protein
MKFPRVRKAYKEAESVLRRKPRVAIVYLLLRFLVILTVISQFFNRNYENVFLGLLTLFLFVLPTIFERKLMIDLPDTLEVIILLFIFAAQILGEIQAFYTSVAGWDTALHTVNGFLCAAVGFSLVDMFNRNERFSLSLSPVFMAIVAFCFSMTIGVMWEIFEYSMDYFMGFDMQKDFVVNAIHSVTLDPENLNRVLSITGITDVILVCGEEQTALGLGGYLDVGIGDTMKDLIVNFIGAVVFSVIGYFYVKNRGKGFFAKRFIPQVLSKLDELDLLDTDGDGK